jgi:putative ABC transport system ATP-binding protein
LIELQEIKKVFPVNGKDFCALNGVNFQLQQGEMISIVGQSGSGKSTLMNILGFLDLSTDGHYLFRGKDVSRLNSTELAEIRNKKIGFVFQSAYFLHRFDVLTNVMLPLFYRNEKKEISEQKALSMLEQVGMKKFVSHKPQQLSGGQQQRVALARALVGGPDIILADEPTGALDSKTGHEIIELLINLNKVEKRTIVMVTHDLKISQLCERTVTLMDGVIVE